MKIGRVIGRVWATAKDEHLESRTVLLVRPLDLNGQATGQAYLAVDSVDAGAGETVLVVDEGNSAGQVLGLDQPPIRTVIVGVVDEVDVGRSA
ncbi:MAG TPA: EutN/CcmL family microcompartment protein [bacterium]|nr:EutN/CcmL family microcompartment protein [bacterium]